MKKTFGSYIIGWLAALGLFNVVTFVTPNEIDGVALEFLASPIDKSSRMVYNTIC